MNKCIVFLQFLNKGSTILLFYLFHSTTYIIKFSIYLLSIFLSYRTTFSFTNPDYLLIRMTSPLQLLRIGDVLLYYKDSLSSFHRTLYDYNVHRLEFTRINVKYLLVYLYILVYRFFFFTVDTTNLPNNSLTLLSCQLCIYLG
jgi:hypothetical protein